MCTQAFLEDGCQVITKEDLRRVANNIGNTDVTDEELEVGGVRSAVQHRGKQLSRSILGNDMRGG